MFQSCKRCLLGCKNDFLEICVHMIDNGNNKIRGGRVERDVHVGGDEKQLIKLAWPKSFHNVGFSSVRTM